VSLVGAVRAVYSSRLFWPVCLLYVALTALNSLLPLFTPLGILISLPALFFLPGYRVSVARAVFTGEAVLPSPAKDLKPMFRRGLSVELIFVVLLIVPMIVFFIGMSAVRSGGIFPLGAAATVVYAALVLVVSVPTFAIVWSRYVAFDELSEGFRYLHAWRRFRAHSSAGLLVIGYWLTGNLLLSAVRFAVVLPLGLYSGSQRTTAAHGSVGAGFALVGIEVLFAALWAPWQLVSAHLLGQFASVAYVGDCVGDSLRREDGAGYGREASDDLAEMLFGDFD
jgi:hypothetical protein